MQPQQTSRWLARVKKRRIVIFVALVCALFGVWASVQDRRPLTQAHCRRIQPGMTKEEVVAILGRSEMEEIDPAGGEVWRYKTTGVFATFWVVFGRDGKVSVARQKI